MRAVVAAALIVATVTAAAPPPDPPGSPAAWAALRACRAAADVPAAKRAARVDAALAAAEAAVKANDADAIAHFAVFCSLGEKMRLAGLGLGALTGLRRLRREVDRTLELAPDFPDALAGKGALLLGTP